MALLRVFFFCAALSPVVKAETTMTCKELKGLYKSENCCGMPDKEVVVSGSSSTGCWKPAEPPLQAMMPSLNGRPHYIIMSDIDSPPYAYLKLPPYSSPADLDEIVGIGPDMINAMGKYCGFDVTIVQGSWADCWTDGKIGQGLLEGWYHACMLYTHAVGVRNRYLEFSGSYFKPNKPAGLLTRLVNGVPVVKGMDDLAGKTIIDVTGWVPVPGSFHWVINPCTGEKYSQNTTILQGDEVNLTPAGSKYNFEAKGPNDRALLALLNGVADAMWVYGDQAAHYQCPEGSTADTNAGWNCEMWGLFKTDFAYVAGGMFRYLYNGTTVTISKKGAGVAKVMDECLEKFLPTKEFYDVCKTMHGNPPQNQIKSCIPNEFFKEDPEYEEYKIEKDTYMFKSSEWKDGGQSCSTGYCTCDE